MKSEIIASGEILPREMWHLFSSWGSACISPRRLNDNCSTSQLLGCDVWREMSTFRCVHMCISVCCLHVCVCSHVLESQLFIYVMFLLSVVAVHLRPSDHPLLTAKLLSACHYGDTGCYTWANHCGGRDVKKLYAQEVNLSLPLCVSACSSPLMGFSPFLLQY